MMTLLDEVIIFLSRLLLYLGRFRRFPVNILNNLENFVSVIIIHFIFYEFPLVIFVDFVDKIIFSFFKVLFLKYY